MKLVCFLTHSCEAHFLERMGRMKAAEPDRSPFNSSEEMEMETTLSFREIAGQNEADTRSVIYGRGEEWERMLCMADLQKMVRLSRSMLYRMIGEGRFPAPRKVGRSSRWLASEVLAWMRTCKSV